MGRYKKPIISAERVDSPVIEENRHHFDAELKVQKPNPMDYVFSAAISILEEYNNQDFHHQADPLSIEALSIAPTLFYGCDTTPAVHLLPHSRTFIKVQLKLAVDLDYGWEAGTVMVKDGDGWITLRSWLKTLPAARMRNIWTASLREQYR